MTNARKKVSRAKEINIILSFFKKPKTLLVLIKNRPQGGNLFLENIKVEYGNIISLVKEVKIDHSISKPFEFIPKYIAHLDNLSSKRKKSIEKEYKLENGSISSGSSKVDILIVKDDENSYFISFKDDKHVAKLGQVSKTTSYGKAKLSGSLNTSLILDKYDTRIFNNFTFKDTDLTKSQFNKLSPKDQKLALIKKISPDKWFQIWNAELNSAYTQLEKFGNTFENDKNSFIDFVKFTFGGGQNNFKNFYLVFGNKVHNFDNILEKLKKVTLEIKSEIKPSNTGKKKSLLIYVKFKKQFYGLTKIEPSFDGSQSKVSQTKGIIFYFQQYTYLNTENDYKKLFEKILQ